MHASFVFICALLAAAGVADGSPTFRRVVPPDSAIDNTETFSSLALALTTAPALEPGAVIQIEPGALPSILHSLSFDGPASLPGFTIRGNRDFDVSELPPLIVTSDITAAGPNVHLENLKINLTSGKNIIVNGPGFVLSDSLIQYDRGDSAIQLNGDGALIATNRLRAVSFGSSGLITVLTATNTTIQDNEFSCADIQPQIIYNTAGAKNDVIERNVFRANTGNGATSQIAIGQGVTNVTLRQNVFIDYDFSLTAIAAAFGSENIVIESNRFDLRGGSLLGAVSIGTGLSGTTTSFKIAGNDFALGTPDFAVALAVPSTGTVTGIVEGNRFRSGSGISFTSLGGSLANLDFGGGSQGSLGGNDFRALNSPATATSGAIVAGEGTTSVSAQKNIFTGNPSQVIYDQTDNATRASVDTGNSLSGNAAFAGALYSRFLRRAANLQDAAGAGAVLAALDDGANASKVVAGLVRSDDHLNFVIDDAYHSVLQRGATLDERAAALIRLRKKTGREEDLLVSLFKTATASRLYGSDRAFVSAAFNRLLNRLPTDEELARYAKFAGKNRPTVVKALLRTPEFKTSRVNGVFRDLLRRDPTADELRKLSRQDRLTLLTTIAATSEFQTGG